MKLTFGTVILYHEKEILLVKEKSEKHEQLEKWNLVSGKVDDVDEFIFEDAIKRETMEETGIDIEVKGLVGVYESVTTIDRTVYFVMGATALNYEISIGDDDIINAKFFRLDEFWDMDESEIVHQDMKTVTKNFMDGKYIDLIRTVKYQ